MQCLCDFLYVKCQRLRLFRPSVAYNWLRDVDRTLLAQGWQEIAFINPANLVFLYMLLRDLVSEDIESEAELELIVMTALYLSYSYMGNEISYPLQPFLRKQDRHDRFWDRTLYIIELMSGLMLKLNADAAFFAEVFAELKNCSSLVPRSTEASSAQHIHQSVSLSISQGHQQPPPPPPRRHPFASQDHRFCEQSSANNENYPEKHNDTSNQRQTNNCFNPSAYERQLTENNGGTKYRKVLTEAQNGTHQRTYSIS